MLIKKIRKLLFINNSLPIMNKNNLYSQFNIGDFSYGNPKILFKDSGANLKIGKYVSIADEVEIFLGGNHRVDWITTYPLGRIYKKLGVIKGHPHTRGDVLIGNDVWIGRGATILSGVNVGDGAVIGARAVVTNNVEPYSIVAGNPAKHIRYRFNESDIEFLLKLKWWNKSNQYAQNIGQYLLSNDLIGLMNVVSEENFEKAICPNGCDKELNFILEDIDRLNYIPGEFKLYECPECTIQITTPRPNKKIIGKFYPNEYSPYNSKDKKNNLYALIRNIIYPNHRKLPKIKPGSLLDVGCSNGEYMEYAQKQGWNVEGVEFSKFAAEIAQKKGFHIYHGDLEEINFQKKYDVVTAWMVIEHLHEPNKTLKKIRNLLNQDGYLLISIPDTSSISRKIFGKYSYDLQLPTHLFHFNIKSINIIAENNGWNIEKITWQKNCQTLLKSLKNLVDEKYPYLSGLSTLLNEGKSFYLFRYILGIILAATKNSGRIEVWMRVKKD